MNVLSSVGEIEFEIQTILSSFGSEFDTVRALKEACVGRAFTTGDQQSVCEFFLRSGQPAEVIRFLVEQRNLRSQVVWKYFAYALVDLSDRLISSEKISFKNLIRACYLFALENQTDVHAFSTILPSEFHSELQRAVRDGWKQYRDLVRTRLQRDSETYRSQGLDDYQSEIIENWLKTFPDDEAPRRFAVGLREQKAIAALEKKIVGWKKEWSTPTEVPIPEELRRVFFRQIEADLESAHDLAIAARFMNEHALAAELLKKIPELFSSRRKRAELWLYFESLVDAGFFVDLLGAIENFAPAGPDETASRIYYQARALNGLGRKKEATELLLSLLQSFPDYPRAESFLSALKDGVL